MKKFLSWLICLGIISSVIFHESCLAATSPTVFREYLSNYKYIPAQNTYSHNWYMQETPSNHGNEGIVASKITDLDNDGNNELLIFLLNWDNSIKRNSLEFIVVEDINGYAVEQSRVTLSDDSSCFHKSPWEDMKITFKNNCVGYYYRAKIIDGLEVTYKVCTYDGHKINTIVHLFDPGYTDGEGIYDVTNCSKRDYYENGINLYCGNDYDGYTGIYSSYADAVNERMSSAGITAYYEEEYYSYVASFENTDVLCSLKSDTPYMSWQAPFTSVATFDTYSNILDGISVVLNDKEVLFDQPPIMDPAGRVLVPIRQIAETMGDDVMWNQDLQTAFIHHKERALIIPLNMNHLYIATSDKPSQWQKYDLDVPSQEKNGRTLTPLRAFCEGLGADVDWDDNTKTVYITYNNNYEYTSLSEQEIDGINIAYGLMRNNSDLSFDKYNNEIINYFNNSDHTLNNIAMSWGDGLLDGIVQFLSGEDATEAAVKERLAYIVAMMAEMDRYNGYYEIIDNIMFNKSGLEALNSLDGLPEKNIKIKSINDLDKLSETVPELENLSNAFEDTGIIMDVLDFGTKEIVYLLSDYTQNIAYLDKIEKYLLGTAAGTDVIYESIDALKREYSEKWIHTLSEIRDDGTEKVISALLNHGTGGVFDIVNFAKDLTNTLTGLGTSAEGLREFYASSILNIAFDKAYSKMADRVYDRHFYADDMIDMFNIQKATKIATYESMNKIANSVDELSYDEQIYELKNKSYILWE